MNFSTFSIVARDPETGQIGVAGGTNWFCYGRFVPHSKPGVGALVTQAATNMLYVSHGLDALQHVDAETTLRDLLVRFPDKKGIYQLLMIDSAGNTSCHTGENCHNYAGYLCKKNFAIAGNTLVGEQTITEMADYYEKSDLPFALKIIKTLQAGEAAGGDIRGMKSAAIKVVKGKSSNKYWDDTLYDLRVDENSNPLKELERLYNTANAYRLFNEAIDARDDADQLRFLENALKYDSENTEILFWIARKKFALGKKEEAQSIKEKVFSLPGHWKEYWRRIDERERV
jgi:uncharacterized Ntn-hydrolase superfamily protein